MFGKAKKTAKVAPACEYCACGRPSASGRMILCEKKGVVAPGNFCKRFVYDPLRRVPRRRPDLPDFDPSDFSLE